MTDPAQILADDGLEQAPGCLFCGETQSSVQIDGIEDYFFSSDPGSFQLKQCDDCGSLWLSPRPFGDRLSKAYSSYYTHTLPQVAERTGIKQALRNAYIGKRFGSKTRVWDLLVSNVYCALTPNRDQTDMHFGFAPKGPAKILDFGCGNGEYALRMAGLGNDVVGVDFDEKALDLLRREGITAIQESETANMDWDGFFDHIALSHVIEHVSDPNALLRQLFGWLKPGGTLYLEAPGADATGLRIFGKYWRGLEAPRHLSVPSRQGLERAITRAGFEISAQYIRNNARDRVWPLSLEVTPEADRGVFAQKAAEAETETDNNAEFLTYLCRK